MFLKKYPKGADNNVYVVKIHKTIITFTGKVSKALMPDYTHLCDKDYSKIF